MLPRPCAFAIALPLLLGGTARAADEFDVVDKLRPARPTTMVTPKFPAGRAIPAGGVKVDIRGRVKVDGSFVPASVTAPPGNEAFVLAVNEVLPFWRFEPAADNVQCAAKEQDVELPVWFEGTPADPQFSVALPKLKPDVGEAPYESVRMPKVEYPHDMLRNGIEGQVRILALFAPSGNVLSAKMLSGTNYGAFDYGPLRSVSAGYVRWKEPVPTEPVCMIKTFMFCMARSADAARPFSDCRK